MKKLLVCILTFGILIATPTKAEIVLYCQDELATGFSKQGGEWRSGKFKLLRHTVKFNDDFTRASGLTLKPMECVIPLPNSSPNRVHCVHLWGAHETFAYDKKNTRYTFVNMVAGYVRGGDNPDTDVMYSGTCESF
jgi:hypothetical protein|tara:strand:+ start:373 stop:780 length:408 start_codon:yes stop_codon:yes gene_type:complete